MKMKSRDYWKPQPGSWEEAVDPYEVQLMRQAQTQKSREQNDIPIKALDDRKTPPSIPITF